MFEIGPAMSGTLVNTIGFEWMLFIIAILDFMYAPLLYLLRNPPTKEEKKVGRQVFQYIIFIIISLVISYWT